MTAGSVGAPGWFDRLSEAMDRGSEWTSYQLFRLAVFWTMPALVALVTLDVVLRYVFNSPLEWGRDVNGLLLLMTLAAALPHAWDRAYHIRMEVVHSRLSPRARARADVLSAVAGIVVFGMMTVQAARFVPFMIATGETGEDLRLPIWPFMAFLSLCGAILVARLFANPAGVEDGLRWRVSGGKGLDDDGARRVAGGQGSGGRSGVATEPDPEGTGEGPP